MNILILIKTVMSVSEEKKSPKSTKNNEKKERKKRELKETRSEKKERSKREFVAATCLEECTLYNTKKPTQSGETTDAKVVAIYDGDTITIAKKVHGVFYRFNCRLNGFDAPELKSKNPLEKKWGRVSKKILSDLILDKIVTVTICDHEDKYGRLLVNIMFGDINVNEYMLNNGYCVAYGGATKEIWDFTTWDRSKLTPELLALLD